MGGQRSEQAKKAFLRIGVFLELASSHQVMSSLILLKKAHESNESNLALYATNLHCCNLKIYFSGVIYVLKFQAPYITAFDQ